MLFRLASLIPLPILYGLLRGVSFFVRLAGWRRGLVRIQVGRCLPELDEERRGEVERGFYRYLGERVGEIVHGVRIDREALLSRVRFENEDVVHSLLKQGRRVMILAAHHCNWEWLLLAWSARCEVPLTAAYKPASADYADRQLRVMRGRFGAQLLRARELVSQLLEHRGLGPEDDYNDNCYLTIRGPDDEGALAEDTVKVGIIPQPNAPSIDIVPSTFNVTEGVQTAVNLAQYVN